MKNETIKNSIEFDLVDFVWDKEELERNIFYSIKNFIKNKSLDERFYKFDYKIETILNFNLEPVKSWTLEDFKITFEGDIYGEDNFLFYKPLDLQEDYKEFVMCKNNLIYLKDEKPKEQEVTEYIYVIV